MDPKPQKKPRGKAKKIKQEEIEVAPENVIVDEIPSEIPAAESNADEPKEEESKEEVPKEEVPKEEVSNEEAQKVENTISKAVKTVEELESVIDQFSKLIESESEPTAALEPKESVLEKPEFENIFEIKSLLNLIIITAVRPEMQEKYELKPEMIKVISLILQNNSQFFTKIEESFKKIVADNKIDADDVPELMSLFSNMYEVLSALKLKKKTIELSNTCGDIIKLVFNIMLTEKLLTFEGESVKNTTECFNALVDSSTSLIKLSKTMKISTKCCVIC
jgi:hypothetical protein